ncbi:hypothetical protein TNCV_3545891 [Trichonephila clavipes]|nr:hypothetical protein TNCV_3545891 [Trichonephila clavipes]
MDKTNQKKARRRKNKSGKKAASQGKQRQNEIHQIHGRGKKYTGLGKKQERAREAKYQKWKGMHKMVRYRVWPSEIHLRNVLGKKIDMFRVSKEEMLLGFSGDLFFL